MITFSLPWPPSINHYYIRARHGVVIGAKGQAYRKESSILLSRYKDSFLSSDRLSVSIALHPPDKRKRDIDNPIKVLLDCMQASAIFEDDNQIDYLTIKRHEIIKHGRVTIQVSKC